MRKEVRSVSADATEKVGELMGQHLSGGEVINLSSDLGGGKTTFVRGLAKGAGSRDNVSSPTFTIKKVYKAPKLVIHHFDFYRLDDAGIIEHELAEIAGRPDVVTVIEWGDIIEEVLPKKTIKAIFKPTEQSTSRLLVFEFDKEQGLLFTEL